MTKIRKIQGHSNKAECRGCGFVFNSRNPNKYSIGNDDRLIAWSGDFGTSGSCPFCHSESFKIISRE